MCSWVCVRLLSLQYTTRVFSGCIGLDEAAAGIEQLGVVDAGVGGHHTLEPGVRAQSVETTQQAWSQRIAVEDLPTGQRLERIGETDSKIRIFEHVEQAGHRPTA